MNYRIQSLTTMNSDRKVKGTICSYTIACYLVRMFDVSAGIPDQVCTGYYLVYIHTASEIPQVLEIVPIAEPLNIDVA